MRVEHAHEGWVFLSIFFMLVFACLFPADRGFAATPKKKVAAAPQATKRLSARETAMVNSLLRQAQQAHALGNTESAKSLLFQARRINPQLPRPAWLKKSSPSASVRQPEWSLEQLTEDVQNDPRALTRLAKYVKQNPDDREAKQILIQEAIEAGNLQILQHITASGSQNLQTDTPNWLRVIKWLIVYALFLLIVWQVLLIEKDLMNSRK